MSQTILIDDSLPETSLILGGVLSDLEYQLDATYSQINGEWHSSAPLGLLLLRGRAERVRVRAVALESKTQVEISAGFQWLVSLLLGVGYLTSLGITLSALISIISGLRATNTISALGLLQIGTIGGLLVLRAIWAGSNTSERVGLMIRARCDDEGIPFELVHYQRMSGGNLLGVLYAAAMLLSVIFSLVVIRGSGMSKAGWLLFLVAIVFGLMLLILVKTLRVPGASERLMLGVSSLTTSASVMLGLGAFILLMISVQAFSLPAGSPSSRPMWDGTVALLSAMFITLLAVGFTTMGIRSAPKFSESLDDFARRGRDPAIIAMRDGGPFLTALRLAFGLFALLAIAWNIFGMSLAAYVLGSILTSALTGHTVGFARRIHDALTNISGSDPSMVLVIFAGVLILMPALTIPVLLWNIGLWTSKIANTRVRPALTDSPMIEHIHDLLSGLDRSDTSMISVMEADQPGTLCARQSSVWSRQIQIVADPEIIHVIKSGELRALLAHELAHVRNGDCLRRGWLRLFCRVFWLGDACIGLFENSLQVEYKADLDAVEVFQAAPSELASGLERLMGYRKQFPDADSLEGFAAVGAVGGSGQDRHRGALSHWRDLYCKGGTLGYWHPSTVERCAKLRAMVTHGDAV